MRGRFFLARFIALLIAALGLLGPGLPAHASPAAASAVAAMPADCPMNDHARKPSDGPAGMAAGCACCCAVVAGLPDIPGAAPPSVVRLAMAPTPVLTGGPGRSIPPALGPPRSERDLRAA
ncbi:MAG: hypothetical protein JSR86_16975 [Proteobacteria bacterium]|nr:hypothetical protein [Pseudomonadota bacterium]